MTLPNPNPIPNTGSVAYNYTVDPSVPNGGSGANTSNTVNTKVNTASINNADGGLVKAVDKTSADLGQTLTYTLVLKNTGNSTANNVTLTDTIPSGTTFVASSVTVNGSSNPGDPGTGINVGSISPNGVTTVTFRVTINSTLPTPNPIPNSGRVGFAYTVDPALPDGSTGAGNSNIVNTQVNTAAIDTTTGGLTKAVDKTFANIGDTLTYTITLRNTGNVSANNVNFTDTIPNGTTFVANSVTINGTANAGNPGAGINVGTIGPSQVTTLIFKVQITTTPNPNPIPNGGRVAFTYTVDSAVPNGASGTGNSNIVTTNVNSANIGTPRKFVDKTFSDVSETLTYTIVLSNSGNSTANNVVFKDTIPTGTTFIANSVTVNGASDASNPQTGINVGSIAGGGVTTITFNVRVASTLPTPNPIPNNGTVNYTYTVDPSLPDGQSGSGNTNQVTTQVNTATIDNTNGNGLIKSVNKAFAIIGETLTYTIRVANTGNVSATNVVFTDTIPTDTNFVANSVTINGTATTGSPATGINLPTIPAGTAVTITFQVTVATFPNPNPIPNSGTVNYNYTISPSVPNGGVGKGNTNTVNTQVNQAVIDNVTGLVKAVDKAFAIVGDTLTYTVGVRNTGNTTANAVTFIDTIPTGTTFVANSVTINGTTSAANPQSGFTLGNIDPNGVVTVTFKVTVTTFPTPNPIPNTSNVTFSYTLDPSVPNGQKTSTVSNQVTTQVSQAVIDNTNGGGLVKAVDKTNANLGDTLTYTIRLKNTGNATATSVIFSDTVPTGTSFIANSVTINGTADTGNPGTGINVGNIAPGATTTVVFRVIVDQTLPTPNPIPNNSTVNYNYTLDPALPDGATGKGNSNQVTTQVNNATIDNTKGGGLVKAVDKTFANIGDTLTYTLTLRNTGNVTANNVVLTDTIPNGTTFAANTLTINGTANAGNPGAGVNVGNIAPGATTTVIFRVTITTTPNPNPIPNSGRVAFTYTVDPAVPNGVNGTGNSNIVNTTTNNASIGAPRKLVDKTFANVSETLTYTIILNNTGNASANNLVFRDTIPNGTTYIANSVTINGSPSTDNPVTGVNVGVVGPSGVATLTFQVVVNSTLPSTNPVPNSGRINYTYTVDPANPDSQTGAANTNIVTTQVNTATIDNTNGQGLVKTVNKAFAQIGDTLIYTIAVKNTGNVAAASVVLTDTIPTDTTFITGSVTVNGVANAGNPATGINLATIAAGAVTTVVFNVRVATIPNPNPIPNNGTVNYVYTVNPSVPNGATGTGNTNTVTTQVNQAIIDNTTGLVKAVDKAFAIVGDTLTYTVGVRNTGNTTASTVTFIDTIPSGTAFVPNSLTINAVQNAGNPQSGVSLGNIPVDGVVTVTFQVTVTTFPTPNPIPNTSNVTYAYTIDPSVPNGQRASTVSNQVTTRVNQAVIDNTNGGGMVKAVDKTNAKIGDTLTYTVALKNTGNVTATNVLFTDTIPNDTTFVANSVTVNGVADPGNPQTGISITSIAPGATTTILFRVTVAMTLPTPNPIPNNSTVNYNYTLDPALPDGATGKGNSNQVTTQINNAAIDVATGGLTKTVDKAFGNIGDTLTYTLILKNTGNVSANNVVLTDTIPNGTTFVANSVTINGAANAGNPGAGINVGTIGPNATTTLVFRVTIVTKPNPNPIPNSGRVAFTYTVDPALPNGASGTGNSNIVNTTTNNASIGAPRKLVDKTFANVNETLTYTIILNNTGNVSANNLIFRDTIPNGTTFIANSVTVNGTPSADNPATGVSVGVVGPTSVSTVTFQVVVNSTLPSTNPVPNSGRINYTYTVDPAVPDGQSGGANTNIVTTQVNTATIDNTNGKGLVKAVDKAFAQVGDTLTYTITVRNTGNVAAVGVVFTDTIPTDTNFVLGSVTVNNVPNAGNPGTGINLATIAAGAATVVVFKVTVATIPNPNPIPNNGTVNYTYTVNPSVPNGATGSGNTNTVNTQVNQAIFDNNTGIVKTVDKAFTKVGETITYTTALTNTGNVGATNVIFSDTIPNGTTFVAGSLVINGTSSASNPQSGVNVGSIAPSATTTVVFQVVVSTIPVPNPIPNTSKIAFNYTIDPSVPNGGTGATLSKQVITQVNQAYIDTTKGGLSKVVDKTSADVGDTLTYTITLKNTGNATATNIVLTDTIPNDTSFITGSVTVGGTPSTDNPQTGVNVGQLGPNVSTTVVFKVVITTIPVPNPIPNSATVGFNYTVDPAVPNGAAGTGNSNIATTRVNTATGTVIKAVSKAYAKVGDTLTYTVSFTNSGTTTANNAVFKDTIPTGTTFIGGSVFVNGTATPGSPQTGISLGTIGIGRTFTVTFTVFTNTIPVPNPIPNQGLISFNYTVDPSVPNGATANLLSNIVNTQVNQAYIDNANGNGLVKAVDLAFADVGDTLTYTITLKNTGNATADNVVLTDTIPNGTTFIPGTVLVNGSPTIYNPATGVSVGSIGPSEVTAVQFKVRVNITNTVPTPNPVPNNSTVNFNYTIDPSVPDGGVGKGNSNTVNTLINHASINTPDGLIKSVDKAFANVNDTLTYTLAVRNTGNVTANNTVIIDTIPTGTTFIPGTVTVNGVASGGSPDTGINLGTVGPNATGTITFRVRVATTIPTPNPIPNAGRATFTYTVDPSVPNGKSGGGNSNIVRTQINNATFGTITKTVDKLYALCGDTLTYTIAVPNTGNTAAQNAIITDTLPNNTIFVTQSVRVDGVLQPGANPASGVNVGTINAGQTVTMTYQVLVTC